MNKYVPIRPLTSCTNETVQIWPPAELVRQVGAALNDTPALQSDTLVEVEVSIWRHFLYFAKSLGVRHYFWLASQPPTKAFLQQSLSKLLQHSNDDIRLNVAEALIDRWPALTPGWHWVNFAEFDFEAHLWFGDPLEGIRQIQRPAKAIAIEPELLKQPKLTHALSRLLEPQGILFGPQLSKSPTEVLKHAGFSVDPALSENIFRGGKANTTSSPAIQHVAVIGAGVAGALCAYQLTKKGLQVTLFDQAQQPASGASGNWAGAFHPHFTKDDTPLSQLTRLGCEHTIEHLKTLSQQEYLTKGVDWDLPGHLLSIEPSEQEKAQATLARLQFPEEVVRWHAPTKALPQAGYWISHGGWVKPPQWIKATLAACHPHVIEHYQRPLTELPSGFDAVVVACAQHSLSLATANGFKANQVKGQITRLTRQDPLPAVMSGLSYAIDPSDDTLVLGATYERPVIDMNPTDAADKANIERFSSAFPSVRLGSFVESRCAVRSVWPDRLPAVGNVPGLPNIYLCTGFASRGLTWAAMAGWQIAHLVTTGSGSTALLDKLQPSRYYQPGPSTE